MFELERTPEEPRDLLRKRISQLALRIEDWDARTHADEDFGGLLPVRGAPGANWRRRYATWPARRRLRNVDRLGRELREKDAVVPGGAFDLAVEHIKLPVGRFYRRLGRQ